MITLSRRNLFALASGLLVPYEPERVYSFAAPRLVQVTYFGCSHSVPYTKTVETLEHIEPGAEVGFGEDGRARAYARHLSDVTRWDGCVDSLGRKILVPAWGARAGTAIWRRHPSPNVIGIEVLGFS